MLDNFNKYRNKNGYIDINNIPKEILDRKTYGSRKDKFWFNYEENEYLFKPNMNQEEDVREILNEEMAKILDIENAKYDLAIFQGKKGVISKNFILSNTHLLLGIQVLCKYNLGIHNDIFTYMEAIKKYGEPKEKVLIVTEELLKRHILDILSAQRDRNIENIAFIESNNGIALAPRYDSAGSFLSICTPNKMLSFIMSQQKEEQIKKYNGIRTRLRVLPGSNNENSIDEFFSSINSKIMPDDLKQQLYNLNPFIEKALNINFTDIYNILREYNISLPNNYYNYYRKVYEYKVEEFQKKRILNRKNI